MIARNLQLPRLEARLLNESVRVAALSGEPIDESVARRITSAGSQQLDGIGDVTAELMEDSSNPTAPDRWHAGSGRYGLPSGLVRVLNMLIRANARVRTCMPRCNLALCLGVAGNTDEAHRILSSALRTCAALGLSQVLLDEGPQMLRLAKDTVVADEFSSADPTTSANVRDFVLSLAETSSV